MKKTIYYIGICFTFISSCNSQISENEKVDFTDYYYYLNLAIDANLKNNISDKNEYLWKAYSMFPKQDKIPMPSWMISKFLRTYSFEDTSELISFIREYKISADSMQFLSSIPIQYRELIKSNAVFVDRSDYFHKNHIELQADIDTLLAIDQYICGNKSNIDTTLVPDKYKLIDGGDHCSSKITVENLKKLHKEYGYFGASSCEQCILLGAYVHTTNYDWFIEMDDYLKESIKLGYLTPNEYAWAFDRSYNQKFGTFYYFFSLNQPFNTSSYKSINEMNEEEKEEIDLRRREIGLPPIPYSFTLITPNSL